MSLIKIALARRRADRSSNHKQEIIEAAYNQNITDGYIAPTLGLSKEAGSVHCSAVPVSGVSELKFQ